MKKALFLSALAVTLLVQLVLLGSRRPATLTDLSGPERDSLFPTFRVTMLGDREAGDSRSYLTANNRCSVAVFMDVNCSICARMRYSWPREYRELLNAVGDSIDVLWLFGGSPDSVSRFLEGFRDPLIDVALVENPKAVIRTLGVFGTPISYLIDDAGRFKIGLAGNRLPPADEVSKLCRKSKG